MIGDLVASKAWKPISIAMGSLLLSHIFFADDLILFTKASMEQVKVIKDCLKDFVAGQTKISILKNLKSCSLPMFPLFWPMKFRIWHLYHVWMIWASALGLLY